MKSYNIEKRDNEVKMLKKHIYSSPLVIFAVSAVLLSILSASSAAVIDTIVLKDCQGEAKTRKNNATKIALFKRRTHNFENGGVPYFGVEFNPLISGGPSNPDMKKMLKVTQIKSGSIFTNDMGYSDQSYSGAWNVSSNSKIATACAEMNRDSRSQVCSVLQGAILATDAGSGAKPLDLDAAFLSARHANGIFPNSVWGLRLGVGFERGGGYIKDTRTGYNAVQQLRNYFTKAHGLNLKIGVFVGMCGEILGGDGKKMLVDLAAVSDFFICGVYPVTEIQDPQDYLNYVTQKFEVYRPAYARVAPKLELILQTGWNGADAQNQKYFWDGMQRWANEKEVKVYMHEAFDSAVPRGGFANAGYWRLDGKTGQFMDKASGRIVVV